ncbi:hypothetical protein E2C01_061949 [Portunus trituberculatus]|uniref:Uncharacterized protein n=1 Tax=Portunus trituberculatus TaxID=210409 RepID=A0A5B7HDS5_PORTR|nr:hypothetical protein [Portunus trituberculatus]
MADSGARGSEMPKDSEPRLKRLDNLVAGLAQAMNEMKQETSAVGVRIDKMAQETNEMKQETNAVVARMDLMQELGDALAIRVSGTVDGRPCPLVVDTGVAKTFGREEVVAAQDLPVSDRQLYGVIGHCTTLRGPVMSTITVER